MKIKKFLKKVAEEDRESIIDDKDVEFLASIGVDYDKKKVEAQNEPPSSYYLTARAINYKVLLSCIACFIVVALTVTLILYFYLKPAAAPVEPPPIHYFEDNFVDVDSDLQELNNDLKLFSLTVDENIYDLEIKKIYDSVSGDTLYYVLRFNQINGLRKVFKLNIVVNSLYEHKQSDYKDPIEVQIEEYSVKYTEISEPIPDTPFSTVRCLGEMQIGEQWIQIENYEEMTLGQSTFIETLQSLISFN